MYALTYDDTNLPAHYGWKWESRLGELGQKYQALKSGDRSVATQSVKDNEVRRIISELDDQGRWVREYGGERLVGQAKMPHGAKYLSSELFSANLATLAEFIQSQAEN